MKKILFKDKNFEGWKSLNDTVMGGASNAVCEITNTGLLFKGNVVEESGGFVSCRSPIFNPLLNLNEYLGFELKIDGQGRTYKFAVACQDQFFGLTDFIPGGLKWIKSFPTRKFGITKVNILFKDLSPSIRANKVKFPFKFQPNKVKRIQLLHSKFGDNGLRNDKFKQGPIRVYIKSISAI